MYKINRNKTSFTPSGIHPRSQQEAIPTPFIGYAVFEGDVVNVSHLELQFDFDVTTDNRSMWPGGECVCVCV